MSERFYSYVSTKCGADCVQTIFLCAPEKYAINEEKAREFAKLSGWIDQVEKNAALLIMLIVPNGWNDFSSDALSIFYNKYKNEFKSLTGISIPGRDGIIWLWETMIYAVGYDEGADYLGNVLVKHSNFFAGAALINGGASDFSPMNEKTDHWFVAQPTSDYSVLNKEVPVPVWLFGYTKNTEASSRYFSEINHTDHILTDTINGIDVEIHYNLKEPAQQVRTSFENSGVDLVIAKTIMNELFNKSIRWKNSPEGTIKRYLGRNEYLTSQRFKHYSVKCGNFDYPYSVHIPKGLNINDIKGYPLVISLHGRGEPTWVFAEKNGWDKLADETKEFIVVFPDSKFNIWQIERDYDALETILNDLKKTYEYDPERVYLTGFSNGAIYTCQQASTHPWLFAAASPWNGPDMETCKKGNIASYVYHPDFIDSDYELPFFIIVGDNDSKAIADRRDELEIVLPINGCSFLNEEELKNYYTKENKFEEGHRFKTNVYRNSNQSTRVGLTVMKNMPHGAIFDESRAAWNFMKRFRRPNRNKHIEEV
jgi:poly(3-hydroxybutyrate) depolymerase